MLIFFCLRIFVEPMARTVLNQSVELGSHQWITQLWNLHIFEVWIERKRYSRKNLEKSKSIGFLLQVFFLDWRDARLIEGTCVLREVFLVLSIRDKIFTNNVGSVT